ncbi:hypothetical protein KAI78_10105 [bacterium]|nr:hypothetical protein [bacterium]
MRIRDVDELGIRSSVQGLIELVRKETSGLIAVTGQTATGKTTSLLSLVLEVSTMGQSVPIVTGEKDLESDLELPKGWNIYYAGNTESAWAHAIDAAFNDQSSVIVLTELHIYNIRSAIEAINRGRWVFVCIDTPFVGIDVTYNLRALGLTNQEILVGFSGIVSQILLPRLCQDCAEKVIVDVEDARLVYPETDTPKKLWREVGCEKCNHQGTQGRLPIHEVLLIDDETRLMVKGFLEKNLLPKFPTSKYIPIQHSARKMVRQGKVGINTYKQEVFQNPLLRVHHLLEREQQRSTQIQRMFSRFVTHQVAEQVISQKDFERIVNGERRRVTCVFADIRGFTTRSEKSSPTEIFRLLNEYFGEMIDIIFRYEGTIDKFIGDSIMVVFGAPVTQKDHELRAVQCAIDIQTKIVEINRRNEETAPVHMGIGINTGEVAAGCLGNDRRMDYTVLGDTINTAARLESQAKPGQILLGPETLRAVRDKIKWREVGELKLKGKTEMIETVEVVYT